MSETKRSACPSNRLYKGFYLSYTKRMENLIEKNQSLKYQNWYHWYQIPMVPADHLYY